MRVLVATTAGAGHFGPVATFARACAAAGHEVAVAAPLSFRDDVAAAGFEHRPFADAPAKDMERVFERLPGLPMDEANALIVAEVFGRLDAQSALPGVLEVLDDWRPDLVLREPCELGSLAAAASRGIPQAMVAIGVSALTDYILPVLAAPLAELDALAGIPAGTSTSLMRSSPTLTVVPPALDGPRAPSPDLGGPLHRFRDDQAAAAGGRLPEPWGDPAHPLVYVSFGSVTASQPAYAALYPAVLATLAHEPVRVLLTTGQGLDPATLGPLPPNAHVERWWPQAEVMPHAAAVVGHGGYGTTMAALAAGAPQVVVPLFAFDQHLNAEHLAAAGAGIALGGGPTPTAGLARAVAELLTEPSYRRAAGALADAMAALPPIGEAVGLLERIASA